MGDHQSDVVASAVKSQEQASAIMEKLVETARVDAVFGDPVTAGDYTVVTASEVMVGMGFGYGLGGGSATGGADSEDSDTSEDDEQGNESGQATGFGGGGGGGGFSKGRPVAIITIGAHGVHMEPIVDATKISLAFFTMLGAMMMMMGRMRKAGKRH